MFFDEFEKISKNKEVCSALLHITDNSQNDKFRDNFLGGIETDLSELWFIYSMNSKPEDNALSDRIFYIQIEPYSKKQKIIIAKDYILKKSLINIGYAEDSIILPEDSAEILVNKTSSIRELEYLIGTILNKINFLKVHKNKFETSFKINNKISFPFCISKDILEKIL
jgi:ATP-dependent Lon protease